MKFRELIKEKRLKKELSLRDLSDISNIGASALCRYENGLCEPTLSRAIKLMEVLGISFKELEQCTED